ncbi:hypothetical protein AB0368_18220 [Actinoplanes sp. NPDC051475]|uniref:hypothetical protein n=1 Tax=Actinoplanes sp. NPDC051475 TaxID=3157225 RepID=UPI00344D78E5
MERDARRARTSREARTARWVRDGPANPRDTGGLGRETAGPGPGPASQARHPLESDPLPFKANAA